MLEFHERLDSTSWIYTHKHPYPYIYIYMHQSLLQQNYWRPHTGFIFILYFTDFLIIHNIYIYIYIYTLYIYIYIYIYIYTCISLRILCYILTFDLAKNVIPRWCTGRKWHILTAVRRGNRVGGNWLMKWDEVKKFPWYTHRLMHRKRVTCELHDSYFRLMTIKHAISKIE